MSLFLIRYKKACVAAGFEPIGLMEYTNFNMESFQMHLNNVNGKVPMIKSLCTQNSGMNQWFTWISNEISSVKQNKL